MDNSLYEPDGDCPFCAGDIRWEQVRPYQDTQQFRVGSCTDCKAFLFGVTPDE